MTVYNSQPHVEHFEVVEAVVDGLQEALGQDVLHGLLEQLGRLRLEVHQDIVFLHEMVKVSQRLHVVLSVAKVDVKFKGLEVGCGGEEREREERSESGGEKGGGEREREGGGYKNNSCKKRYHISLLSSCSMYMYSYMSVNPHCPTYATSSSTSLNKHSNTVSHCIRNSPPALSKQPMP